MTPTKKNILSLIIFVVVIIFLIGCYFFLGNNFGETVWIIGITILGIILLFIMLRAGLAVLKSLFFVAAELSLLIFLSQAYCSVSNRTITGDIALKNLLALGLLYIAFNFGLSLYKELRERYVEIRKEHQSKEKLFNIIFFIAFTVFFIWQIYLIVSPIIFNFCVYH